MKAWLNCAESRPSCYALLFHELGHFLSPCFFLAIAEQSDQLSTRIRKEAPPEAEARLSLLRKLRENAHEVAHLVDSPVMFSGRDQGRPCLGAVGDPKDAVPSSCNPPGNPWPEEFQRKCHYQARKVRDLRGYPSQWEEALADSWSATLTARWLKRLPAPLGNEDVLHAQISSMIADWCADQELNEHRKVPLDPTMLEISEKLRPGKSAWDRVREKQPDGDITKQFGCEWYPKKGITPPSKPWNDPHQPWDVRWNRYYLRNTELRSLLGCGLSEDVPVTCSIPRGVRRLK